MLAIRNTCMLPAPPEFVWQHYTNVEEWAKWATDIQRASGGPVCDGAAGRCKYKLLPEGSWVTSACNEPYCWTLDWGMLATRVRFAHELTRWGGHGTHVVETISFHGLLALPLGLAYRPRVRTDWPAAMAELGRLALASWVTAGRPPSGDLPRRGAWSGLVAAERPGLNGAGQVVAEPRVGSGEP
jgi:hypothetical protein